MSAAVPYRPLPSLPSLLLLLAVALIAAAPRPAPAQSVAAAGTAAESAATVFARSLAAQRLPQSAASFVILDPQSGKILASHLAEAPRSPASTIKTVTTFAALDLLGPAFTWHTRALLGGPLHDGVLEGDLLLQGGGDPYITLERWWSIAQALRDKGLRAIRGDIVIDASAFAMTAEDPAAFDGKPNRSYNVLPDALMVNFQSVQFHIAADADVQRVDIAATPAPVNLVIDNQVRYVPGHCTAGASRVDFRVASPQWDRVIFSGTLAADCVERNIERVLLTPAGYAYGTFVRYWRELGGEFNGSLRLAPAPPGADPYFTAESLPLAEIIRLTNKYSSNLMARHLLLTLGSERFGPPATVQKGGDALAEWGRQRGLDLQGLDIDNGSGLSRATHISALQMARILAAALRSPFAPEYLASLPLAGIDGTLRSRLKGGPAGAVRLKTGHLDGVSGIAGYVTAAGGKPYVLVSLVNHPRTDVGAAEPVHAALVGWLLGQL